MPEIHILRTAVQDDGEKLTMAEMWKRMPPCPICGRKAYLEHIIVDGFDFGYDAGCPIFCLDDGVHGISEPYDPEAPRISSWKAELAFKGWLEYCEKKQRKIGALTMPKRGLASDGAGISGETPAAGLSAAGERDPREK